MNIVDYIAIAVVVLTLSAAVFYIVRAKKRGEKCVGCPYSQRTLKDGVERLLKTYIKEVIAVEKFEN